MVKFDININKINETFNNDIQSEEDPSVENGLSDFTYEIVKKEIIKEIDDVVSKIPIYMYSFKDFLHYYQEMYINPIYSKYSSKWLFELIVKFGLNTRYEDYIKIDFLKDWVFSDDKIHNYILEHDETFDSDYKKINLKIYYTNKEEKKYFYSNNIVIWKLPKYREKDHYMLPRTEVYDALQKDLDDQFLKIIFQIKNFLRKHCEILSKGDQDELTETFNNEIQSKEDDIDKSLDKMQSEYNEYIDKDIFISKLTKVAIKCGFLRAYLTKDSIPFYYHNENGDFNKRLTIMINYSKYEDCEDIRDSDTFRFNISFDWITDKLFSREYTHEIPIFSILDKVGYIYKDAGCSCQRYRYTKHTLKVLEYLFLVLASHKEELDKMTDISRKTKISYKTFDKFLDGVFSQVIRLNKLDLDKSKNKDSININETFNNDIQSKEDNINDAIEDLNPILNNFKKAYSNIRTQYIKESVKNKMTFSNVSVLRTFFKNADLTTNGITNIPIDLEFDWHVEINWSNKENLYTVLIDPQFSKISNWREFKGIFMKFNIPRKASIKETLNMGYKIIEYLLKHLSEEDKNKFEKYIQYASNLKICDQNLIMLISK